MKSFFIPLIGRIRRTLSWGLVAVAVTMLCFPLPCFSTQTISLPGNTPLENLPSVNNLNLGNLTFQNLVESIVSPWAKFVLLGVAVFYIAYYGARLVLASGNEETIKKSKLALTYAFIGFIIINANLIFNYAFNPADVLLGRPEPEITAWQSIMGVLIGGLRYVAGAVAVGWLILAGFRMVTAGGKEDVITKNRAQVIWSIFGLIIVALAGTLEDIIFNKPSESAAAVSLTTSLINLMLLFTAPLGFFLLIIGGMYMILSHGNETMLNRGKKIVQYTVIALVIIYSSYVIISELFKFAPNFLP